MKYSLKDLNSFGVESYASNLFYINSIEDFSAIDPDIRKKDVIILGGGTNMLFKSSFIERPVFKIQIKGIEKYKENENEVYVSVGAGVNWDHFVLWCLDNNFGGVENLISIPGNVGSAPIQNIGAYGKEVKDTIVSCEGIFIKNLKKKTFTNSECNFNYRTSVFKDKLKNLFAITKVNFVLSKSNHQIFSEYESVKSLLKNRKITNPSIIDIANIIKEIRDFKLPNYKVIGNAGSFFKNPIINKEKFEKLKLNFKLIPNYYIDESNVKIPAAWLIEACGYKKIIYNNVSVHSNQSLVIVNLGNAKGVDIYTFSQNIKQSVLKKFDILLEEEVNIL
ncbi:MAG: UDP-N-acetylenolpyruvoylglucosamine reductase [Cryomorphaceae bacterium MED-G14]|nr:MAG: UDP-N-acetylenolpyruvoylglucosamine reductase [Cryomorphaceae bacterium MED-G14]